MPLGDGRGEAPSGKSEPRYILGLFALRPIAEYQRGTQARPDQEFGIC